MKHFALSLVLLAACSGTDGDANKPGEAEAGEGKSGAAGAGTAPGVDRQSLTYRSCQRQAELEGQLQERLAGQPPSQSRLDEEVTDCLRDTERMREDSAADEATFDRFLQCRLDAAKFEDAMACAQILADAELAKLEGEMGSMMADAQAGGDAALERIREDAKTGVISAETLARIESDRDKAGMGRFGSVLDDAHAQIAAGRVAPGTTMEIVIHPGLGGEVAGPPRGEAAADLLFTDAKSGLRVARISPIGGVALALGPMDARVAALLRWWIVAAERHAVEIGLEPDSGGAIEPMPSQSRGLLPMLQDAGLADRPLLVLPDGSRKSATQWAGS